MTWHFIYIFFIPLTKLLFFFFAFGEREKLKANTQQKNNFKVLFDNFGIQMVTEGTHKCLAVWNFIFFSSLTRQQPQDTTRW